MCGICGAIGTINQKERVLLRMMKAIAHRGPDGQDTYITKDAMLGFQRLSIIDQTMGMQPMYNEDRSKALVFNGEIYNYRNLRGILKQKGHKFHSLSDSEVLIHGYEEYHLKLLEKLRGMFSFAIWDERNKTFFAARDYFGIKPFYYAVINHTLVFASEIKSILQFPGYQPRVNEEALEQYLSFQYSVLPETFFKGIYQLLPGHYLTYENQELKVVRYFEPTLEPKKHERQQGMLRDVRNVMYQSVRRHLISDVEVGSFLSGGVDSSLLAAMSGCNKTFTVAFENEGKKYNEGGCAKSFADSLQIENRRRNIEKEEFREAVPSVMYYLDEPSGDASAVALYFLSEEASKDVKVVLSGEGADEIFGGYNIYLEPKMRRYISWLPKKMRCRLAAAAQRLPKHAKGRNYLLRAAHKLNEWYIGNAYIFHEEEKEQLLKQRTTIREPQELLREDYARLEHLDDSDIMQSLDLKYWLPGDILQKADKMSMAHSLELRVPFLDRDVFQVARKIPHRMRTRHYTTKYVLRKAISSYLPKAVADRKKLGFPIPIRNWMKEEDWYEHFQQVFTGTAAAVYFHTDYLLRLLREHKEGIEDHSRKIWTVYAFLIWYQVFFEQQNDSLSEIQQTVKM
ncbi:MAG: asparagine synthase (glutamine-hydrolyzing) [Lachnospiraceae bacterium]|nr:asparagine synthase (glutamine-hydrolyzing) [Lachnospiraceae bacterium]